VLEANSNGVATLRLSLTALRLSTTSPSGQALVYDSADPEKSSPEMREELSRFVGPPLALLRIDSQGRVLEVKESKHGPASRFESEPPFVILLPPEKLAVGQKWHRKYRITLEPPQGTGEQYPAIQQYTCTNIEPGTATIAVATQIQALPEAPLDRVPLLQMQPEGEVSLDISTGRLRSARLHIEKQILGHQGPSSSYRFQSEYREELQAER
jgi:hypothetical protein